MSRAQKRLLFALNLRGACPEAREWVADYDLPTFEAYLAACPNAKWLCWLNSTFNDDDWSCICGLSHPSWVHVRVRDVSALAVLDRTRELFPFDRALDALGLRP